MRGMIRTTLASLLAGGGAALPSALAMMAGGRNQIGPGVRDHHKGIGWRVYREATVPGSIRRRKAREGRA